MKTNAEVIKQLEKDFGLSQHRIYDLMSDEFKKECKKADLHLDGETKDALIKIPDSGISSQAVDKGFRGVDEEQLLISQLGEFNIRPERKVPFKGPCLPEVLPRRS